MLIGVNGFKRAGKDTIADYLVAGHGYEKLSFAEKLKESTCALFNISPETLIRFKEDVNQHVGVYHPFSTDGYMGGYMPTSPAVQMTMRVFLQRLGTGVGRNIFGEDFWVMQVLPHDFVHNGRLYVINDARFENELQRIKDFGGITIQVTRPGTEPDGHASEVAPPEHLIDFVVENDGTFEELYEQIDNIVK